MKQLAQLTIFSLIFVLACTPEKSGKDSAETTEEPPEITVTLEEVWSTDTVALKTPESVLYDTANNVLYISCINGVPPSEIDRDGYIAKVNPADGAIIEERWVTGLSAPKGMGLYEGKLYVSDIDQLVVIDIESGTIVDTYAVSEAEFLNDITVDPNGVVYISDSNKNRIYRLEDEKITIWKDDATLGGPNGLFHDGEKMMVAAFGSGTFYEIDYNTLEVTSVADSIPGGDGVVKAGADYIVSNWNGEVYYVTADYRKKKILDTKDLGSNAADIELMPEENLLLVPTFFGNSVVAYRISR